MATISISLTCAKLLTALGVNAALLIAYHPLPVQRLMLREMCARVRIAPVYHNHA